MICSFTWKPPRGVAPQGRAPKSAPPLLRQGVRLDSLRVFDHLHGPQVKPLNAVSPSLMLHTTRARCRCTAAQPRARRRPHSVDRRRLAMVGTCGPRPAADEGLGYCPCCSTARRRRACRSPARAAPAACPRCQPPARCPLNALPGLPAPLSLPTPLLARVASEGLAMPLPEWQFCNFPEATPALFISHL